MELKLFTKFLLGQKSTAPVMVTFAKKELKRRCQEKKKGEKTNVKACLDTKTLPSNKRGVLRFRKIPAFLGHLLLKEAAKIEKKVPYKWLL